MQQYTVNQRTIAQLLHYIEDGDIVIPEIQRPFVWDSVKVRDLIDSLYRGYPVGYIITWKNPSVRLKNGELGGGKQVLIDGQQRITALMTAIAGREIVDNSYRKRRIVIAFHPLEEKFETLTPAIRNTKGWIHDISEYLQTDSKYQYLSELLDTSDFDPEERKIVEKNLDKLDSIKNREVGIVDLEAKLDIEAVTEIFVRINSAGVPLEQADFAMSKIASYEPAYDPLYGVNLRKVIDYFSHLIREPHFLKEISLNDSEFAATPYLSKISWLGNERDLALYEPEYKDILRVSFVKQFRRGKTSDLVKLLSGQNFETREFDYDIQVSSFDRLKEGILDFINPTHFKRYLMILESAGFIQSKLINSQTIINMGYVVYLTLRQEGYQDEDITRFVSRWVVLSILTERYSTSPESSIDKDIRDITEKGIEQVIDSIEKADLNDSYWQFGLVKDLDKGTINNPFLKLYFVAQIKLKDPLLFSTSHTVESVIRRRGDIHHIFPKDYLKKNGFSRRSEYNQIANLVYLHQEENIRIGNKSPKDYFAALLETNRFESKEALLTNLKQNSIPESIFNMEITDYNDFLEQRRVLMAQKLKEYYECL